MANLSFEEKVWVDAERKLEGILQDLAHAADEESNVLLLAHFEDTLAALSSALRARSVSYQTHFNDDASALCASVRGDEGPTVWLTLASHFRVQGRAAVTSGAQWSALRSDAQRLRVLILVAEHHPLASKDEAVLEAASRVHCRNKIIFHTALTDALLKRFGGDRMQGLLRQLGHDEAECVSHPLISKAIRNAQEKIGAQVAGELPTRSAEEWFEYNLRS